MSTNFPTALDSLTNPAGDQPLGTGGHVAQHANANDAIEALQAKVGVTDSTEPTSLDYRVKAIETVGADMKTATYDSDHDGKVNAADTADAVPWSGVTSKPSTYPPASHVPFEWVVADATARAALAPSASDVYKQCLQLSDYTIWTLSSVSPVTWRSAGSDSTAIRVAGAVGLWKTDSSTPAFVKTGAGTISVKADVFVVVAGVPVYFSAQTAITMPTLTAGTDYAIYVCTDGTIRADANWSYPSGYSAATSLKIGGFHYAPGGNASAQAGGDTTPAINEYSIWDLKFRPSCSDPRGMTLVAGSFWADIYLLGVDHLTNGTSKYNVSIAAGSAPPKIPTKFGGTGSNAYSTLNWWETNEVLQSWGKRAPTYDEFAALAYGTTEATASGGSDVPTTGVSGTGATNAWNKFTSRWGVIQATGCMWIWGGEFGGGAAGASWTADTGGRGSTYQMENALILGGYWGYQTESGSRCSNWYISPTMSYNIIGARGVCGHYVSD